MIQIINGDCLEYLKDQPDQSFDLAIVDPPYRDAVNNKPVRGMRTTGGKMANFGDAPRKEYFDQLFRVSRNSIIWGGNYFPELWTYKVNKDNRGAKGFIFWNKQNPAPNFSDGELAFSTFDRVARCFNYRYYGNHEGPTTKKDPIHPTQKPIALYEWILYNYAEEGDRILDTHLGSGSSAIAAHNLKFGFVGLELDPEYYQKARKRLHNHQNQLTMF